MAPSLPTGSRQLAEHGQLGAVFLQYPKWFFTSSENRDAIREAKAALDPYGLKVAVEFRNATWFNEKNAERTMRFLTDEGIPLVMVDSPQGFKSSIPPVVAATSPELAVVRFHRRRHPGDLGGHERTRHGRAVPLPV